jgi:hypothetical protein
VVSWGLPDSLFVEVHLHLAERLPKAPTGLLFNDPALFEGDGMVYGFNCIDPGNRLVEHAFRFQVRYHADEQTLIVLRGAHVSAQGLG